MPQDHKWHTGGIFDSGQVQEWHYWTGFFTDDATGEQFGIFYNITNNPSAPGGPSLWQQGVSFSFGDFAKQELIWSHQLTAVGSLQATRPPDSTSPDDFQYNAKGENVEFTTVYRAEPDTWNFHFTGVAASNGNPPIVMDIVNTTQSPYGYMPVGLGGFENENIPWNGQNLDPTTMYSLSYYYTAPISSSKGTVTIGGQTRNLTGTIWFEHQWGNFNSGQEPWTTAYTWGALTFDNGNVFTWRQWYGAPNGSAPLRTDSGNRPQLVWDAQWHTGRQPYLPRGEQRGVESVEDLEITGERAQHRHSGTIDQLLRDLVPHERLRQLRNGLGLPTYGTKPYSFVNPRCGSILTRSTDRSSATLSRSRATSSQCTRRQFPVATAAAHPPLDKDDPDPTALHLARAVGGFDEHGVENVGGEETISLRDLLHHVSELQRQLHGYINKRCSAAHFEDPGDHPSDRRLPGLVIVTVCHRSPPARSVLSTYRCSLELVTGANRSGRSRGTAAGRGRLVVSHGVMVHPHTDSCGWIAVRLVNRAPAASPQGCS